MYYLFLNHLIFQANLMVFGAQIMAFEHLGLAMLRNYCSKSVLMEGVLPDLSPPGQCRGSWGTTNAAPVLGILLCCHSFSKEQKLAWFFSSVHSCSSSSGSPSPFRTSCTAASPSGLIALRQWGLGEKIVLTISGRSNLCLLSKCLAQTFIPLLIPPWNVIRVFPVPHVLSR